jgi:hypothetical protein
MGGVGNEQNMEGMTGEGREQEGFISEQLTQEGRSLRWSDHRVDRGQLASQAIVTMVLKPLRILERTAHEPFKLS